MIRPGLVSISFRRLNVEQIIDLCKQAKLQAIEWGGDIHVPHGDVDTAEHVGTLTREAGLTVAAYGSYYRLGVSEADDLPFEYVLASAKALKAPTVRVWAGTKPTKDATDQDWDVAVTDARRIADRLADAGLRLCIEYHKDTLTDHHEAAIRLHERIDLPNVDLLWQPPYYHDLQTDLESIKAMLPRVSNVHVYWWTQGAKPGDIDRHPLADAEDHWRQFFDVLESDGRDRFALLEYVKGDEVQQLLQDAQTLNQLLAG